jgi:lipopolysaccharide exporter
MATGALWMVLAKLAERSLGFVSTLILARVLVPHDFGIVAMAMTFVALAEMLGAFGFDATLIQKQTKERVHWDTAWTFDIMLGIVVALLLVVGAHPVAAFFKEPALVQVLPVLALGSLALGFQNIGVVAFRAEMRFDREFRFQIAKKLIGFAITVPLAIILDSYWALVIGQTAGRFVATGLSYWVHPYRPRLSLAGASDLLGFSKWLLAINSISYLKERSSDWVIGRLAGPASLGAFNVAYELASLPSTELIAPINRAVFPAYAKLAKESPDALRTEYLSVIAMIVLIASPAVLGMAAVAPLLVPVMLGPNWTQAVPLLALLGFFGFTNIIQSNAQAAYLGLGRADIPAKLNAVHVVVQLGALVWLTRKYGVVGSAVAYLITAAVMIPPSIAVILRMLRIRASEFFTQIWRPVAAAAVMYIVVVLFVRRAAAANLNAFAMLLALLIAVGTGAILYFGLTALFWWLCGKPPGAEQMILNRVTPLVARLVPRRGTLPT